MARRLPGQSLTNEFSDMAGGGYSPPGAADIRGGAVPQSVPIGDLYVPFPDMPPQWLAGGPGGPKKRAAKKAKKPKAMPQQKRTVKQGAPTGDLRTNLQGYRDDFLFNELGGNGGNGMSPPDLPEYAGDKQDAQAPQGGPGGAITSKLPSTAVKSPVIKDLPFSSYDSEGNKRFQNEATLSSSKLGAFPAYNGLSNGEQNALNTRNFHTLAGLVAPGAMSGLAGFAGGTGVGAAEGAGAAGLEGLGASEARTFSPPLASQGASPFSQTAAEATQLTNGGTRFSPSPNFSNTYDTLVQPRTLTGPSPAGGPGIGNTSATNLSGNTFAEPSTYGGPPTNAEYAPPTTAEYAPSTIAENSLYQRPPINNGNIQPPSFGPKGTLPTYYAPKPQIDFNAGPSTNFGANANVQSVPPAGLGTQSMRTPQYSESLNPYGPPDTQISPVPNFPEHAATQPPYQTPSLSAFATPAGPQSMGMLSRLNQLSSKEQIALLLSLLGGGGGIGAGIGYARDQMSPPTGEIPSLSPTNEPRAAPYSGPRIAPFSGNPNAPASPLPRAIPRY